MNNIPIYRAKKIDSDEWVEGYLITKNSIGDIDYNSDSPLYDIKEIDPKTLAIHFPNMIDKNGKKIFASLNEDGIGGDKGINPRWVGRDNPHNEMVYVYKNKSFVPVFVLDTEYSPLSAEKDFEVTGIHK